jgi:hypothetical protein
MPQKRGLGEKCCWLWVFLCAIFFSCIRANIAIFWEIWQICPLNRWLKKCKLINNKNSYFAEKGDSKDRRSARGVKPLRNKKLKNEVFSD